MSILEILSIAGGSIVIIRFILEMVKPNADQDTEIALLKAQQQSIMSDITTIKVNHLAHIERDVRDLQEGQVKIFTILDERLPNKTSNLK